MSIIEMGLRGIPVITNVLELPNTRPWNSIEDIEKIVQAESGKIGNINTAMANEVRSCLVNGMDCFDFDKLLIK